MTFEIYNYFSFITYEVLLWFSRLPMKGRQPDKNQFRLTHFLVFCSCKFISAVLVLSVRPLQ